MTTKLQSPTPSPFSRFSRIGIFKSSSPSPNRKHKGSEKVSDNEDNWYIPYNGPYEAPRQPYVKPKDRDSWGDSVYGDDDGDDRHAQEMNGNMRPNGWYTDAPSERTGRPRAKTTSAVSTSGRADTNRTEARNRQPFPSYINIDASGGVGESPSLRTSRDTSTVKRSSFANIFNFSSSKKLQSTRPLRISPRQPPGRSHPSRNSGHTDDEEYYNSYYSTLVHSHSPLRNQFVVDPIQRSSEDPPSSHTLFERPATASPTSHPYAYRFPTDDDDDNLPHTAPLVSTNSNDSDPFRSHPMRPSQSTGPTVPNSNFLRPASARHSLKNSISTPDLRNSRRSPAPSQSKPFSIMKGRDRWLSPETWCDALFLPRPRFKVKEDGSINYGKRVVSPPGSPVVTSFTQADMMSRVVAHSRSMVDLQARQDPGPSTYIPRDLPPSTSGRPPRPKSFALDDLALPSPVPSLSRVLEEGQILEHQRKKWQMQAQGSFQNRRTRSFSRARTKSQTAKDAKQKHPHMDFLAARSFAGNQEPIPILKRSPTESRFANSKSSHTHSTSLSKTLSTTKTHSRTHSRNDSWGKTAIKVATGVLCNVGDPSPAEEKRAGFEDALHADGTRVIRFEDPSMTALDPALLVRNTPSQASTGSDVRMGIALSTPPIDDRESIHLSSHPYAQGGMYTYNSPTPAVHADFAGPHLSSIETPEQDADVSRHRLPPRVKAHPYALYADRDPIEQKTVSPRVVESEIPTPLKMWAQIDDGEVREVRPDDIHYSPYMSESGTPVRSPARNSGLYTIWSVLAKPSRMLFAVGKPVDYDATRPLYRQMADKSGNAALVPKDASPISSSPVDMNGTSPQSSSRPSPPPKNHSDGSTSNDRTPDTSSSQASPRPLGSVDDLENFRDLFYRPNLSRKPSNRSQLTNLARQLSHEFEEMNQSAERHISGSTHISSGSERSNVHRDGAIQFVFSDLPEGSSGVRVLSQRGSILPFHPSISIPEDVEASSVLEKSPSEEESDELFRLGQVEHLATPPAVASTHRTSFIGQFVSGHRLSEHENEDMTITQNRARSTSLQPPSADPSRTSYTTNSTYSRMSNLSDFPVPPISHGATPGHISLISSYFEPSDPQRSSIDRRLTFGGDAEIDELLDHLNHGR
ncbi:hypothetical protein CPB85DRAFT_1429574 [Mucidula mucida]|nr:hypothetical protein CPB85DRAFT_1429574 [Mucidula mucida]